MNAWRLFRTLACCMIMAGAIVGPLPATDGARAAHVEDGALDNSAHFEYLRTERLRWKWVASWMKMTQQYTSNMMHQMWIIGGIFDAKHQLEVQRLFQQMNNRAHKDYHPSDQMCRFGTNTRSIGASDEVGRVNAQVLATILLNRELMATKTASSSGSLQDKVARIRQFKKTYCDIYDNNQRLKEMCRLTAKYDGEDFERGAPDERTNKDIDYTRTIDNRYTLNIDFTNQSATDEEIDVIALTKNLFAHDLYNPVGGNLLEREFNPDEYQDIRSVVAMRGIARNSIGHIVGQRSRGRPAVGSFIKVLVQELGVPESEINQFLGEQPSYFAQMEVLTRKMYQNPSFYSNLYTKPGNVVRAGVAMKAVQLMQDRDRFEGALRREMLLAMILEVKLRQAQDELVNDLQNFEPFARDVAPGDTCHGYLDCK